MSGNQSLQIIELRGALLNGRLSAGELIDLVLMRIREWDDPALWIARPRDAALRQRAAELDGAAAIDPELKKRLPLFGIPFAVKDNIDVAGMPTAAACPTFAYTPSDAAPVVEQLISAGAALVAVRPDPTVAAIRVLRHSVSGAWHGRCAGLPWRRLRRQKSKRSERRTRWPTRPSVNKRPMHPTPDDVEFMEVIMPGDFITTEITATAKAP